MLVVQVPWYVPLIVIGALLFVIFAYAAIKVFIDERKKR